MIATSTEPFNRVLITGGAGFIGSHLAEALLAARRQVVIVDDLSTGTIENIAHLSESQEFSYTIDSVMNRSLMTELVDWADVVFHLAAAVGVRLIVDEPIRTIETNIKSTELMLELCSRKQTPLLITSTSEVYGKLDRLQFGEEDDLVLGATSHSRWCYAASKIIDEFLARAYFKERKLPVVVVRLFNTIGPRQSGQYGMVVPRFVKQALGNDPITVYGDGTQRRAFTWVGDAVAAMAALIVNSKACGQVFNVGSTEDISIHELALLIKELSGSNSPIRHVSYEEAYEGGFEDMRRRLPDLRKIKRLLDYKPSMRLEEMLQLIIKHDQEKLAGTEYLPMQGTRERQLVRPPAFTSSASRHPLRLRNAPQCGF